MEFNVFRERSRGHHKTFPETNPKLHILSRLAGATGHTDETNAYKTPWFANTTLHCGLRETPQLGKRFLQYVKQNAFVRLPMTLATPLAVTAVEVSAPEPPEPLITPRGHLAPGRRLRNRTLTARRAPEGSLGGAFIRGVRATKLPLALGHGLGLWLRARRPEHHKTTRVHAEKPLERAGNKTALEPHTRWKQNRSLHVVPQDRHL